MEKKTKWLAILAIFLLLSSIVAAEIVLWLYLSTKVKLIIPHDILVEPMTWDWGELRLWEFKDTTNSTQKVTFMSYSAKPLTLSATVDLFSVAPTWFKPLHYSLDWTAEGYEIQPLEILETNFTLTVNVPLVREYMINHQIMEADIIFDIIVSADYVVIRYDLTIETTLNGTTDPTPGTYTYPEGKPVDVTAIPDLGYCFDYWDLDGTIYTVNPISVTMDADHYLIAYFVETPPRVYVDPEHNSFAIGETFTITVFVADVENLYAIDILLGWDTSILSYVSHTPKVPVDIHPDGLLHTGMMLADIVNETAGTYELSYASIGTDPFTGSGKAFEITFEVVGTGSCILEIIDSKLSDSFGDPIDHVIINGYFDNS